MAEKKEEKEKTQQESTNDNLTIYSYQYDEGSDEDPEYNPDDEPPQQSDDDYDDDIDNDDDIKTTPTHTPEKQIVPRTFSELSSQSNTSQQTSSLPLSVPISTTNTDDIDMKMDSNQSQTAIANPDLAESKQAQNINPPNTAPPPNIAPSQRDIHSTSRGINPRRQHGRAHSPHTSLLHTITDNLYMPGVNASVDTQDLADMNAARAAGHTVLNNANGAADDGDNESADGSNANESTSSESDSDNNEEEDSDDDDEDEHMDNDEYTNIESLCLPAPFNQLLEKYLRQGLLCDHTHAAHAMELYENLKEFKHKYEADKAKYTTQNGNTRQHVLRWDVWYNSYWPKHTKNNYTQCKLNNNDHSDELAADLLSLEAFRYELYDISTIINSNVTHFYNLHYPKLQYLVKYGMSSISKIQEHYRYTSSTTTNVLLSWSVVIWLTAAVEFCARHIHNEHDMLSVLCVPLLKTALQCYDYIISNVRRNHHSTGTGSMYTSSFEQGACKLAKRYIDHACKLQYESSKQKLQLSLRRSNRKIKIKACKPRFENFLMFVLRGNDEYGDVKAKMRQMMNALNDSYSQWKCEREREKENIDSSNMDNRSVSVSSHISGCNVFKLPFPWDSATHLTQFLYICEKLACFYYHEYRSKKWIDKIIDAFYRNIINFPTEHIRTLNDVDAMYYQNYTRQYAANSLNHIMTLFNKIICTVYEDNGIDYEYVGEEYDVLHDGNRIMDITFLSIYMKQIGNSNVETQLRGLNKIYDILKKIQSRCNRERRYNNCNGDSPYDKFDDGITSCGSSGSNNNKNYYNFNYLQHKWLSEPRLAEYLTRQGFIALLFERDSHNKILERSGNIIQFLAEQQRINQKDLQLIWTRCQDKHESQSDAYYKLIKTLALSLDAHNIQFLLQIITETDKQERNKDYVNIIYTITKYAAQKRFKLRCKALAKQTQININNNNNNMPHPQRETYWFGLRNLWDISLDDNFAESGLQGQAQGFVVELLSHQCFESQIEIYLMKCVKLLQHNPQHTVKALRFFKTISIRHIWSNTYNKSGIQQQYNAELVKSIAKKHNLLQLVFDDLRSDFSQQNHNRTDSNTQNQIQHLIQTQFTIGAKHESLRERLVFIDFLLRFADGTIAQEQVKELWELVVCNPGLGKLLKGDGLDFFCDAIDPQKQEKHFYDAFCGQSNVPQMHMSRPYNAAFTDDITHYVGNHLCNTLDAKLMTIKHFNLRKAYFYRIGVLDGVYKLVSTHYYLTDANRLDIDWLWNIVFDAVNCNVSSAAQLLIKDVYTLIDSGTGINISLLYETFVDKCMTHAHNATRPSTPQNNIADSNGDVCMHAQAMQARQLQSAPNTNLMAQHLQSLLNANNNTQNAEQANRKTIKRCFSLLRMAIDHFGGKRHGNLIHIDLVFVNINISGLHKDNKRVKIQMGELQTCRELFVRCQQEVANRCTDPSKTYTIKGLIKCGKRIDQDHTTLADEFTFEKPKEVNVVYTIADRAMHPERACNEQKTMSNPRPQAPPPLVIKPPLQLAPTLPFDSPIPSGAAPEQTAHFPTMTGLRGSVLDSTYTPNTPDPESSSNPPMAIGGVDVDIEAMSNDASIIQQQKQLELSIRYRSNSCSTVGMSDANNREHGPSPPPPPSVEKQNGTYPVTPRQNRKPPYFGPQNRKPEKMKQLTLTSMYKAGAADCKQCKAAPLAVTAPLPAATAKNSDYSDFTTGGLTRVDSMLGTMDMEVNNVSPVHPSDILSKAKYFNQLFAFLAYPHDIACEAWEILRKLPLNRDKKMCVKDFDSGWNKMFDLQQDGSVLMARYGLDILAKLTRNDVKMHKQSKCKLMQLDDSVQKKELLCTRWIVQFIRRHGLVLVLQLLISINVQVSSTNTANNHSITIPPEISCASMVIHFLADILQIDNEPNSMAQEILADKQTADLFLSAPVLSSIMKIIGVLSSFTESESVNNNVPTAAAAVGIIGPQLPANGATQAYLGLNGNTDPMKFSTEVLKLCFVVLKFILQSDNSHKLIKYFLSSDLRQWIYSLLIHSPYAQLRLMVKSQLQLLYEDHFKMGQKIFVQDDKYSLGALDKLEHYSQDPRLVVGIVKACLEILGILSIDNNNVSLQYQDRFHSTEFMDFLHDCIRDLVCSFDVLCKYPKYKVLLIEDCNNYNGIDWYDILDKFMTYFISYQVTESQLNTVDDTKLLPIKVSVYSTYFRAAPNDDNGDELYADKCLIGTMKIISKLIQTLSQNKLTNNKLITLVDTIFERGLFPDIDTVWTQRRDLYQLPLCKQQRTRDTAMYLLLTIARYTFARQHIQNAMISHHSAANRLRQYLNYDDWNYLHNILSRSFNGNVGLVNLGATCYMNSLMQQLFANPQFRFSVLSRNVDEIRKCQKEKKYKLICAKKQELRAQKRQQSDYKEEKDLEEYKDEDIWRMIIEQNSNHQIGDKDDENCDMLNELQNIFTYLQESDLRSYDPSSFCYAYKQPGGRPMELRVQMDVDEFFNIFTDKLEKQLQFDSHNNIIQYLFGGVFATQMIGRKDCKHYREKSDPFVTLTLDVKSKTDITQSLNSYVQGEVISDYQCDKCNKRIEILKRSCIRILPRNLVIHLKRFDFDIETLGRAKVNDMLRFPPYLDMTAFTKDGLENKEQKRYKVDDNDLTELEKKDRDVNEQKYNETYDFSSSNMYRLVGIINHSGGTESGHYTSYIREHNDNYIDGLGELHHKWSFANDRIVEDWECKKIPDDCFGGPLPYIHATTTTVTNNTSTGASNSNNNSASNSNNGGNASTGTTTTTTYSQPANKMYSAYMLFYERVSVEEQQLISSKMQNGALSKSYYDLAETLLKNAVGNNHSVTPQVQVGGSNHNGRHGKLSGQKRHARSFEPALEPPHKKQKISHDTDTDTDTKSNMDFDAEATAAEISRDCLNKTDPKELPKYLSKAQQSMILDAAKKERVWNENKAAMIERQLLQKRYIATCLHTVLLSVPKENETVDENELFNACKLALTLLFESIGHCKNLNQIISRKQRNNMCKILAASPLGCKWFLQKLLAIKDNHWLRTLYDPKLNHIYGETMGEVVRDFVITALKCVRAEECRYYKYVLQLMNSDEDDMEIDIDVDIGRHLIVKLIKLILSQFTCMDKADYAHPIFEILMHFAHFGNEERVLLIDLGMIWKGIAYYRKDFNGLQSGAPSKNSEHKNTSSADKIGWKKKQLKDVQCFKALPRIISTLITSIHPEYLETFFHQQHYADNKRPDKAICEEWLHSKCLSADVNAADVDGKNININAQIQIPTQLPTQPSSCSAVGCRSVALYVPLPVAVPMPVADLPPMIVPPLPKPHAMRTQSQAASVPPPVASRIPKLEKIDLTKTHCPFPNEWHKFAISPNVQHECHLSSYDYHWLRNKEVLEYLLEYGTISYLNEVTISHLAHSSNILYKRIVTKITDSFNTAFQPTLRHLFDCIKLILGIFDNDENKYIITTLPDDELRHRCINKILPKLLTCAAAQEAKYWKDAQALMQFAQELIEAKDYSFVFNLACNDTFIQIIIANLFDKNKHRVRHLSMKILIYIIDEIHKANDSSFNVKIIELVLNGLPIALTVASNQSLIDNGNDSFPDDLKSYVERKPKINKYFAVVGKLMHLYPANVVATLTLEENWKILCEIVAQLESGADTFSWAKNDDKLIVLQIMIDIIDKYHVDCAKLLNMTLIDALTSQYLVSTRSNIVSPHMAQVVAITYRLLTHFASDTDTDNWITSKIADKHWFLWAIADIITPNNVYQSSLAANSILVFITKIIDYKCMANTRGKMLKKCMKKWEESCQLSPTKKVLQYPRETVLKLLMLILKTPEDHAQFLHDNAKKLVGTWLKFYFYTEFLRDEEEISTYNAALDFFQFHIKAVSGYPALQNERFLFFISHYTEAICSIFAYCSHRKEQLEWRDIFDKAIQTLQLIFDLEKIYKTQPQHKIVAGFVKNIASQVLLLSNGPHDYNANKTNTDDEKLAIKYLQAIQENGKSFSYASKQLQLKCEFIESQKQLYCARITPILKLFLMNYGHTNVLFNESTVKDTSSIMICCWFLQLIGCKLPDIIAKTVQIYLAQICDKREVFKHIVCGWVIYCILITSASLPNAMFLEEVNMKLMLSLMKGVLSSLLDEQEDNHIVKCKLLNSVKNKTLLKYLPCRFALCIDEMNHILCAPLLVDEHQKEHKKHANLKYESIKVKCYGFVKYYYCILIEFNMVASIALLRKDNYDNYEFTKTKVGIKWWDDLKNKIGETVKIISNDIMNDSDEYDEIKQELVGYLRKIAEIIDIKITECMNKMQRIVAERDKDLERKDVVMSEKGHVQKAMKSKTINKKQKKKQLPLKIITKEVKSQQQQQAAPKQPDEPMVVDGNDQP